MSSRIFPQAAVLAAAIALIVAASENAAAQILPDHLKCYRVKTDRALFVPSDHARDPLVLTPLQLPPFAVEQGCVLLPKRDPRPTELCVPVDKAPRQPPFGQPLQFDYACYRMRCPPEADLPLLIDEQFGRGEVLVLRSPRIRRLCVPTLKTLGDS